jgi:peptidoglycan-associated lipoprotein
MFSKRQITLITLALSLALFVSGCKKKAPVAPPPPPPPVVTPPPPPPPPAPSVTTFGADPTSIVRGQSAMLSWTVSGNVATVSIDQGIGAVQNSGSRRVSPDNSTTYTLTASGPGGTSTASATVTVSAPPPPPPPPPPPAPAKTLPDWVAELQDGYFDYDKTDIRADAQTALTQDAATLKTIIADFPSAVVTIEGHCDERGSAEYNQALGDRRATAARDFLVQLGIPADKLKTISYGKERPQCSEQNESCWQKNRRVHFSTGQ